MCVIMVAETERPRRSELMAAWATNPHGAGVAWVENGAVRFEKVGEDAGDVQRVVDERVIDQVNGHGGSLYIRPGGRAARPLRCGLGGPGG